MSNSPTINYDHPLRPYLNANSVGQRFFADQSQVTSTAGSRHLPGQGLVAVMIDDFCHARSHHGREHGCLGMERCQIRGSKVSKSRCIIAFQQTSAAAASASTPFLVGQEPSNTFRPCLRGKARPYKYAPRANLKSPHRGRILSFSGQ